MKFIRNPVWDGVWILSGPALGLALAFGRVPTTLPIFLFVLLALNSGHLVAPIAMAWAHRGHREVMSAHKLKFIIIPVVIVALGGVAGATVGKSFQVDPVLLSVRGVEVSDYLRPLIVLLPIYFVWNAYHFSLQNYGILRLYLPRLDRAVTMQLAVFPTLFFGLIIPMGFHQPQLAVFCFAIITINHQLAAIGLSSHVWANHRRRSPLWFACAMLGAGSGTAWLILRTPVAAIMTVVGLRVTAGFVHFLYDRWNGRLYA